MLYLSNFKTYPKVVTNNQTSGTVTIDSLDASMYRMIKYDILIEDFYTNSIYQGRFTVTHDSLDTIVSGFDLVIGGVDITLDAVYTTIVDYYPTVIDINLTFPANFNGSWSLTKEVFINISNIQRDGFDGPGDGLFPGPYLYPNNS